MVHGADGRKMSKSYDNYIAISSAPREVRGQVSQMITDPQRARRSDPGRPEVCTVYGLQQAFNQESLGEINEGCRRAAIGCVQCKELLAAKLLELIEPIHEKRQQLQHNQRYLEEVLDDGNRKARAAARATLEVVRRAMHI
jgi:tryptophanyl-tRNA synthetase